MWKAFVWVCVSGDSARQNRRSGRGDDDGHAGWSRIVLGRKRKHATTNVVTRSVRRLQLVDDCVAGDCILISALSKSVEITADAGGT